MPNLHPPPQLRVEIPSHTYPPFSIPSFIMDTESNMFTDNILSIPQNIISLQEQRIILQTVKKVAHGLIFNMLIGHVDHGSQVDIGDEMVFVCDMISTPKIRVFKIRNFLIKVFIDLEDYYQELNFQNALRMAITEEVATQIKCWSYSGTIADDDTHAQMVGYSVTEVCGDMLANVRLNQNTFSLFRSSLHSLMRQMTLIHCRGLFHLRINRYNLMFSPSFGVMLVNFSCVDLGYNGPQDDIFRDKRLKFEASDKYLLSTCFIQSIPASVLHGRNESEDQTHMAHIISRFIMDCYSQNENIKPVLDAVLAYTSVEVHRKVLKDLTDLGINYVTDCGRKRSFDEMFMHNTFNYT